MQCCRMDVETYINCDLRFSDLKPAEIAGSEGQVKVTHVFETALTVVAHSGTGTSSARA